MRIKKKLLALALGLILSAGMAVPALAAYETPSFTDVPKAFWGYSRIEQAAEKGWIKGYPGGQFRPTEGVSYAQLSLMITQAFFPEELAAYAGAKPAWYTPACTVADSLGLFAGTAAEGQATVSSAVNRKMDRYEMAQMVYNTIKAKGGAEAVDLAAAAASTPDWASIPVRYQEAVAAAKAAKVISGTDKAGTFGGSGAMNRAQAAVVLLKLEKAIAQAELPTIPEVPPQTSASFTVTTPELRFMTSVLVPESQYNNEDYIRVTYPDMNMEDQRVYGIYCDTFKFQSSDESVVTVDLLGRVTPVAILDINEDPKTAYITVTNTKDGTSAQVKAVVSTWTHYLVDDAYIEEYAAEVLRLCNESRAEIGVAPLKYMENVQDCVNGRAEELIQSFSHTRPNGKSGLTYLRDCGYTTYSSGGENVAYIGANMIETESGIYLGESATELAAGFCRRWLDSPRHSENIQLSIWSGVAVGLAVDPDSYRIYSVQIFGRRSNY